MAWVKLDDKFPEHPKVIGLSDVAFRAYIVALAYANRYLTDGFVPAAVLPKSRIVRELVEAGLWDWLEQGDPAEFVGIWIHDYLDFQPSRDEKLSARSDVVLARKRAGRARAAAANRAENGTFVGTDDPDVLDVCWTDAGTSTSPAASTDDPAQSSTSTPAAIQPRTRTRTRTPEEHIALRVPRQRDEVFDAVAEVCGIVVADLTRSARGSLNRAVADLKAVGATPVEVRRRAGNWPFDVALTPPGLAKHYAALTVPPRQQTSTAFQIAQQLHAEGR